MSSENGDSGKRRVILSDIAKACGVSSMTVSLALRKHPKISEKTRIRVLQKAEELGYVPDPMLSALNQYRVSGQEKPIQATLAWVNPYHDPKRLRAQIEFDLYWRGAAAAAERMGFKLEEFQTRSLPLQRMNSVFKTRNIQGIIIASLCRPEFSDKEIVWSEMPWEDFAIVRLGRSTDYPKAHYITCSQTANTRLAFEQIYTRGYRRIGFVGVYAPKKEVCAGAYFAKLALPEKQRLPSLLFTIEEGEAVRMQRFKTWLNETRPDAVFTDEPNVLGFLQELGLRVPDDIGLATTSIHDTPIDAGIDQNPEEVGRTAVRTLVALMNERSFGIPSVRNEILVEGRWADGSMLPSRHPR